MKANIRTFFIWICFAGMVGCCLLIGAGRYELAAWVSYISLVLVAGLAGKGRKTVAPTALPIAIMLPCVLGAKLGEFSIKTKNPVILESLGFGVAALLLVACICVLPEGRRRS